MPTILHNVHYKRCDKASPSITTPVKAMMIIPIIAAHTVTHGMSMLLQSSFSPRKYFFQLMVI